MTSDETRARFAAFADQVEATSPRARWLVLTHDNPDPDALAATAVLAMILRRRFKRRTTVAYGGMIGRAENREMVRSLKLELSHLRHLRRRDYQHFALVDCQPWTGNSQLPKGVLPDLVIDHHPLRKATQSARLADVRPDLRRHRDHPARVPGGRRPAADARARDRARLRHPLGDAGLRPRGRGPRPRRLRPPAAAHRPAPAGAHPDRAPAVELLPEPPPRHRGPRRGRQPRGLAASVASTSPTSCPRSPTCCCAWRARPGRSAPAPTATGSTSRSAPPTRAPTPAT